MKNKKQLGEKWISKNGACNFNFRKGNINLYNGGLFQDMNENYAELWMGDLDDTIRYLKRMKSFLNKLGIKTGRGANDYLLNLRRKNTAVKSS